MKRLLAAVMLAFLTLPTFAATQADIVKNLFRSGEKPSGALTLASDGKFYGTTQVGGANDYGSVFRFDAETGELSTVASFGFSTGRYPNGELLDGKDGYLYGTAKQGGSLDFGSIFRIKLSDGSLAKLAQFDGANSGKSPLGGLVKVGSRFFGVASEGGASDCGTIFKVTPVPGSTNWDLGAVAVFDGAGNGRKPWGTLVDTGAGILFGTTELGGADNKGCVFKVPANASGPAALSVVKTFSGGTSDGEFPRAGLMKSKADGLLYGTTYGGGSNALGTVFRVNPGDSASAIVANMDAATGSRPQSPLIESPEPDAFLYGTCSEGGAKSAGSVFKVRRDNNGGGIDAENAKSFSVTDGKTPLAGLIFGTDGLAYGTTQQGGAGSAGAVFRFSTAGSLRNSASFFSAEGANLRAAFTEGANGKLYGSTFDGGASGNGAVFVISPEGNYSVVASFTGLNGAHPLSPVVATEESELFGTTYRGGIERGTFFRITADGTIQPLIRFGETAATKGANPRGAIVRAGDDFFGITEKGGTADRGTIYKISVNPIGAQVPATHTTLLEFGGVTGEFPFGGLVDGGDGFFYGTTTKGGANEFGTFFKINGAGEFTKIYDFTSDNPTPAGTLVKDSAGTNFFGTSDPSLYTLAQGQGPGFGTVYKIAFNGTLTTLHSFTGEVAADGRGPRGVAQLSSSQLTGVTYGDGGTLFRIGTVPGTPTTIYRFDDDFAGSLRASRPEAPPVITAGGAIYGGTQQSSKGGGTVYRILFNPSASLSSVTETAPDAAIARGIVNPNSTAVSAFFEYSLNPDFNPAIATPVVNLEGEDDLPVTAELSNLTPATTYYIRLRAGNQTSRTFFYGPPTATSGAATGIGRTSATVRGLVNPNGRETSVQIEYGTTPGYGTTRTLESAGNGSDGVVAEATLTGLMPQTTYHYRIVATNAAGTSNGLDAEFVTGLNSAPTAPPLLGLSASRTAVILITPPPNLDPDGQSVTLAIDIQPAFGTAEVLSTGVIRFTPNAGFKGRDSFTYSVTDPNMETTVGTVTIRNPFTSLQGSYLTKITNPEGAPIGTVKLAVTKTGAFTGTVNYGRAIAVKGKFEAATGNRAGAASITIPRKGKPPLVIVLHIDTTDEKGALDGTVDGFDITDDARLFVANNSPQSGRYTVWFHAPESAQLPRGHGWATLVVTKKGACTMAGKLGDGTAFSTAPQLRATDSILLTVPLFGTQPRLGRGYVFGQLYFRSKPASDADGVLDWKRGSQPKSAYFPMGFGPEEITVSASRWAPVKSLPGNHAIDLTDGELAEPNNLPAGFTFGIPSAATSVATGKFTTANTSEKVTLSANLKTGTFRGTFVHPAVAPTTPRVFTGVLVQKQNIGVGVFRGTTTSGAATIDLQ